MLSIKCLFGNASLYKHRHCVPHERAQKSQVEYKKVEKGRKMDKEQVEKNEGFLRPGGGFVAPGKNRNPTLF
jgi:hypothetical protein